MFRNQQNEPTFTSPQPKRGGGIAQLSTNLPNTSPSRPQQQQKDLKTTSHTTTVTNSKLNNNNNNNNNSTLVGATQQTPNNATTTAKDFSMTATNNNRRSPDRGGNNNNNNNPNNSNNNLNSTISALPFNTPQQKDHHHHQNNKDLQQQEPTRCDNFVNFLRKVYFWLRFHWRRVMAVPQFFVAVHYILPFAVEIAILAIHFDELNRLPADTPFFNWNQFPRLRTYVVPDSVIGTILLARFIVEIFFTRKQSSVMRYLASVYGFVSIVTIPLMMYSGFSDGASAFHSGSVTYTSYSVWKKAVGKITKPTLKMIQSGELLFSIPSVAVWRVWIVYDLIQTLIFASSSVSKSFRAIVYQLSFIFALFFNCMATMQIIFCVERESFLDLGTAAYFTVCTLTTLGFGDFVPTSPLGRAFIITQIFAAMLAVPLLLAETDRLMKFLISLTGYAGNDRHIIIFGELTDAEMDQLLTERRDGDGKRDPIHLVFVSPRPFSQHIQDSVSASSASDMITLCVANQLSRTELVRFSPIRADAALFFSNTSASAMRGDYRTIAAAASVRLHHPSLPQYLMMRRTEAAHLVEGAFVVFDRDFLRAALLGTSLQIPGFLPMILNLIRHVPDKDLGEDPIMSEHKRKKQEKKDRRKWMFEEQQRKLVELEDTKIQKEKMRETRRKYDLSSSDEEDESEQRAKALFSKKMERMNQVRNLKKKSIFAKFQKRYDEEVAAKKRDRAEKEKEANNINHQSWYNMYLKGAQHNIYTIAVPEVLIGRTFVVASFIVQLRTGALPIGLVRDSRVALNAGNTPVQDSDLLVVIADSWEDLYVRFSRFPTTSTNTDTSVTKIALRGKEVQFETEHHATATALWLANCHNYFPFQNHVVLIDLASLVSDSEFCAEESHQREQFQVQDMIALASRFPKWQSFVLLSLSTISPLFEQEWAASDRQPISHIMKSPLDPGVLKLCGIGSCMSVLIFSSLHVANSNDDEFRSSMLTVNRLVMSAVQTEIRQQQQQQNNDADFLNNLTNTSKKKSRNNIPSHPNVITVIGTPEEALLLAPEHVSYNGETIDHDAHCCAFATGCALSPTLLDCLMFRTYYNEYLPSIIELLLEPGAIVRERADQLAAALFDEEDITPISPDNQNSHFNVNQSLSDSYVQRNSSQLLSGPIIIVAEEENGTSDDQNNNNDKDQNGNNRKVRFATAGGGGGDDNNNKPKRGNSDGNARTSNNNNVKKRSSLNFSGSSGDDDDDDESSSSSSDGTDSDDDVANFNEYFSGKMKSKSKKNKAKDKSQRKTKSLYHNFGNRRLPTFGQLCRVMTASKVICFGFSRVVQTAERGVDTLGKVYFVTNPELSTLIMPDDFVFYLPAWTSDRLNQEFFA